MARLTEDTEEQRDALAKRMWACDDALILWAEPLAYKALEARISSAAAIHAQATTALTALLAVLAGLGGWSLKVLEPGAGPAAWGALGATVYLTLLVLATVRWCINLVDAPAVYNRPGNLLVPGATLQQIRVGELANIDERIRQQGAITDRRAVALNRVRLAAVGVVPVFALGAGVARWWLA